MQILQNPESITIAVATASATTSLNWTASWAEFSGPTIQNPEVGLFGQSSTLAGASSEEMVPTPTVGNCNQVKQLTVHNTDTIAHFILIQLTTLSTFIVRVELQPGDHLLYEDAKGWYVIDSGGCLKTYQCNASGGGGATSAGLYATGNTTSGSSGTVAISSIIFNGLGIASVGVSNGSVLISVPAGAPSPVNFSAGTTSNNLGSVVFSNSNGVFFGLNGSTITASAPVAFSAGTTSFNAISLTFSNANGISFGLNGFSPILTASYAFRVSAGTTSNDLRSITFADSNGIVFGLNASTITASHNGLTSQSNQNAVGSNGNFNFQTISFSNANGISFGTSAGSAIFASHNAITSQSNQQMTLFATGNTTQSSSGTMNASSIIFRGSGVASVGVSNGSVIVDVPAGGGAAERVGFHVPWMGTLQSSGWENASYRVFPYNGPPIQMDRLVQYVSYSQATDSTCSGTVSIWCQIFTKNASTLSNFASGSTTYGWSGPGTNSSTLYMGGMKAMSCPLTATLSSGNYWIGILMRSTTGGANASLSHINISQFSQSYKGNWGVGSNVSDQIHLGFGLLTASTSTTRDSIAFSDISLGAGLRQHRYVELRSGTL